MVFFDYDGVIADSLWLWEEACRHAALELNFQGEFPHKPYSRLNPVAHKEIGKLLGLPPLEFEQKADEYFLSHLHELKPFDGTKELLESISKLYTLSIMSASCEEIVHNCLKHFGVRDYFSSLYCGSEIPKAKKLKRYKQAKSVMIGDSISDIEAAREANVYAIGVLWGWQEASMLQDSDILVANHDELKKALKDFYEDNTTN